MRYFLQLAYRGTNYHGWQRQLNGLSVQEVLETALTTVLRQPIAIVGSGRTDAGVHAGEQFAHFEVDTILPAHLLRSINSLIPSDIAVYDCFPVRSDDHARFTATFRYYQYQISRWKDPFRDGLVYVFTMPLAIDRMNEAAKLLLHYTDYESFSKVKTDVRTFICQIEWAYWEQKNNGDLVFHIRADRFLRGMVRAIVGTLLAVGQDRLSVAEFEQIILARNRKRAGHAVPAEGLSLVEVGYPTDVFSQRKNRPLER
ncbi:tRNA pseudouridine(38-40) synthase TruA [Spirosoma flavum]|uniref:tRNA pseudouridine synthase A n=1 Tax=Spirosoma flavum TaxID=2048557 RepID=A0ABW6AIJ5_9BACT